MVGVKVSKMTRELVMEPEGTIVEVMTVAPGGNPGLLEETVADTEAELEAGGYQELLELDIGALSDAENEAGLVLEC